VWPAKLFVLAGFVLLFLQAISEIVKRVAVLTGDLDETPKGVGHA
jgi:TRAP-type mannitol/chloroaromatic compound transport system permease small subunit